VQPFLLNVISDGGTVTSSAGLGGSQIFCPPTCNALFRPSDVVTVIAHDANGFAFTQWSGDCSGTAAETTVAMSAERTCRAHFRPFELGVTVTGNGVVRVEELGEECAGGCTFEPRRESVSLRAVPSLGWRFDGWSGACSGTNTFTTVSITADRSCTAAFSRTPGLFFLTMIVDGRGSVTSEPAGLECSATCVLLLPAGSAFDITAHETSSSIFSFWLDDCASPGPTNHLVLDRDKTCRARFVDRPGFPIAQMTWAPASPRVGQVVTFDGNGSFVFDPVTNTRDHGAIRSWSWDFNADGIVDAAGGHSAAAIAQYAYQAPGTQEARLVVRGGPFDEADDHVDNPFVAEATQPLFALSVNKAGTGGGDIVTTPPGLIHCAHPCTSAGPVLLESGTMVMLKATPRSGSTFNGWTGAGCTGVTDTIEVAMSAARTCTATFTLVPVNFTLSVAINAPSGSVASVEAVSPPGNTIFCRAGIGGPVCSQAFAPGTVVQVRPSNSVIELGKFGGWVGCDAVGALATCSVTLNGDRTVTLTVLP
jgi:uncharacterized repeat protein (TIGR02543 family)